ncbi:hypothetical protein BDK51DRAFT_47236 [Blyttiomyces helicus]|uniref:Uncharacterized protein n=1 Tax=Blyttiomyces helicus TaxID=388810 RepID=A0A4P9W986_9FUNG|nr:hypothetical protein BDK51DRAFT_47236 [Blyttiomyces helicus]|eukprot:RKO89109.1 hypothetical protein BDK51DRAFT_47236 [Blyttiomyces helicus]
MFSPAPPSALKTPRAQALRRQTARDESPSPSSTPAPSSSARFPPAFRSTQDSLLASSSNPFTPSYLYPSVPSVPSSAFRASAAPTSSRPYGGLATAVAPGAGGLASAFAAAKTDQLPQNFVVKTDTLSVTDLETFPEELTKYIQQWKGRSQESEPPIRCIVDDASGYVVAATPDSFFIWPYVQRPGVIAACKRFYLGEASSSCAFACVVPSSSDDPTQAGLLGCTAGGFFRYWENIPSGENNYKQMRLSIGVEDIGTALIKCDDTFSRPSGPSSTRFISQMRALAPVWWLRHELRSRFSRILGVRRRRDEN